MELDHEALDRWITRNDDYDEEEGPLVPCRWHDDREAVLEVSQYVDPRDYLATLWLPACEECAADPDKADRTRKMRDNG